MCLQLQLLQMQCCSSEARLVVHIFLIRHGSSSTLRDVYTLLLPFWGSCAPGMRKVRISFAT